MDIGTGEALAKDADRVGSQSKLADRQHVAEAFAVGEAVH